ncbi:MAG: hypothetical protein KKC58_08635, partial [Gammaproteobacteria bacterium]|nr:hypothetical protein [Gammaproteobacteria bacterium]
MIFTLTHLARQKGGPSLGAGPWPTVAGEFKRAGFLEGEAIETPPPIGHQTQLRVTWWWRSAVR